MEVRYATEVVAVGEMVAEFREQGVLIFFGEMAPDELHEFVVLHRPSVTHSPPRPGDLIDLDGVLVTITAVGHVVAENLMELGHVSIKADGASIAPLPGDLCVEVVELPLLGAHSTMRILASGGADPSSEHSTSSPEGS